MKSEVNKTFVREAKESACICTRLFLHLYGVICICERVVHNTKFSGIWAGGFVNI